MLHFGYFIYILYIMDFTYLYMHECIKIIVHIIVYIIFPEFLFCYLLVG